MMETDAVLRLNPEDGTEPRRVFFHAIKRLALEGYRLETVRDAMQAVFFDAFVEEPGCELIEQLFM